MTDTTNTLRAALPCPFCGSDKVEQEAGDESVYYRCRACEGKSGRVYFSDADRESDDFSAAEEAALDAWNSRAVLAANPAPEQAQAQAVVALSDEQIDRIANNCVKAMPDGIQGFCRVWGWQQFARELLDVCAGHVSAAPPVAPAQSFLHKPSGMTFDTVIAAVDESAIVELGEPPVAPAPADQGLRDEVSRTWHVLAKHGWHPGRTDDALSACVEAMCASVRMGPYPAKRSFAAPAAVPARTDTPEPLGVAAARPGSPFQPQAASTSIPNAQPVAKPLEWSQDHDTQWTDLHCGFCIIYDATEDPEEPFSAAWGEGDSETFATLEEAKAWCQRDINAWVAQVAEAPAPPQRQPLTEAQPPWAEWEAVAIAHRAGFAGTIWTMGPEELVHLLNLATTRSPKP